MTKTQRKCFRRFAMSLVAATCATVFTQPSLAAGEATADMRNADNQSVGVVTLRETPHGTLLHAKLMNLPQGVHAFHIHAVGECVPPFTSAGGHYNPTNKKHGILSAAGMHAGDMPNIHVPDTGSIELEILNTQVKLDDLLSEADGTSIVIHAGPDDYVTDPAGAAGPRIACGVITR